MSVELSFSSLLTMVQDETGLVVPVSLIAGKHELDVDAYLDTGAKYCVFPRWIGTSLGIDVESGEEISLGTGGGSLVCYLHYLTLRIGSLYLRQF